MIRRIFGATTFALLLAFAPHAAAQDGDFGGDYGGGYDSYAGYDEGGASGYEAPSSYSSYDEGGATAYEAPSPVLAESSGVNANDVAGGPPAAWDPPAMTNDPWTSGAAADPYASATDPWATTASNDPWSSGEPAATSNDSWTSSATSDSYTSAGDPWSPANDSSDPTSTASDPWTTGAAPDPYASASDPWATTSSNDPWSSTSSNEPTTSATDGWQRSATQPEGWSSEAPDGWNSQDVQAAPSASERVQGATPTLDPSYVPSEQAERVVQQAGSGTEADRQHLQQRFDALPLGVRNEIDGSGARIVTCRDNVLDARPGLAGTTTPDGRTMNQVGGVFLERGAEGARYPTAVVCLTPGADGQLQYTGSSGSRDVFGHEVGHVVDRSLGYPSQQGQFQEALNLDRALAQSGDAGSQGVLGSYYNGRLGSFDRGASEAYGESFARYLNDDRGWPNTFQYFASQPTFRR